MVGNRFGYGFGAGTFENNVMRCAVRAYTWRWNVPATGVALQAVAVGMVGEG